jgi:hypothetical protein
MKDGLRERGGERRSAARLRRGIEKHARIMGNTDVEVFERVVRDGADGGGGGRRARLW